MKKLILISLFFFISSVNILTANTNIVFLDMDKVIATSKPGLLILNELNEINNNNIKLFQGEQNKLKNKEQKIISQKNILSDSEFKTSISKLKIEVDAYNERRKKIITRFNKSKIDNTNNLLKQINVILTTYTNEKSISIILQKKNIIIGKTELDITSEIIKIINSSIKEFKFK